MEKKSFAIPEGCTSVSVSEESGRLVIEFEEAKKFEPKKGDICFGISTNGRFWVCFIYEKLDSWVHYYCSISSSGMVRGKDFCHKDFIQRLATQDEAANLFIGLEKKGLKWNAETMKVERLRWKPKKGENYYCLSTALDMKYDGSEHDEARFSIGDCFKTSDDRLAALEKIKPILLN